MSNRNSEITKGLALLSIFTPTQQAAIVAAFSAYGSGVGQAAASLTQKYGNVPPMMSIVPIDILEDDDVISLVLGLRAEMISALYRQATRDDYANVLMRMGTPSSLAYTEAERVLTPDADMRGWVLNNLSWLPAFPFELGKTFAAGAAGILQSVLPEAWINRANDRVYEILRLGECTRELSKRAALSRMEVVAETGSNALNPTAPMNAATAANPAAQQSVTTMAESLLGMLVGSTLGSSLLRRFGLPGIIAGQVLGGLGGQAIGNQLGGGTATAPGLPAAGGASPTPPVLPPGGVGDWDGVEYGDLAGGYNIPPEIRAEAGAALVELMNSAHEFETGGWGKVLEKGLRLIKPLATKLAPIAAGAAGTLLGGPVGTIVGAKIGEVIGSGIDHALSNDERLAVATTAATTRALSRTSRDALSKLFQARGNGATIADILEAVGHK